MSSPPVRVYLVDDDPQLRSGLAEWLERAGHPARAFESGEGFLLAYPELPPGCVIVDMIMTGMSGLELYQRLVVAGCRWPVILLTGHGKHPDAARAVEAGFIAFLEKPVREMELLAAVLRGQAYLLGQAEMIPDPQLAQRFQRLSRREREVLECLLDEILLIKQIAATLGIAENTVKGYRRSLMRKLGAKTTTEVVVLAIRGGLYNTARSRRRGR